VRRLLYALLLLASCAFHAENYSVKVTAEIPEVQKTFSATAFSVGGHVLTAGHFCEAALASSSLVQVEYLDGERFTATGGVYKVARISSTDDLCELEAIEPGELHLKSLDLADSWRAMEPVAVIGAPYGIYPARTEGFLIGQQGRWLAISCLAAPGNSGSPVLNADNEVLGVLVAGVGHVAMIVPFAAIQQFIIGETK
jgi:S1-C subfamily serine protease